ncbi:MAG TPA: DUF4381 domain-containing protein [Polyangiaceae bacterium]|jgi:hypothetical protein|nr:DUF4381 domain-containing protein [Polyangiaceae bacterium]
MTPAVPPYRRGSGFGSLGVRFTEVLEPARVPLRPETVGAWLTIALLGALVAAFLAWLVVRWVRRRHRRVAERELQALLHAFEASRQLAGLETLPVVLKRCALGSFPRERVASLSGDAWRAFLDATCRAAPFSGPPGGALVMLTTRGASSLDAAEVPALVAAARTWVRRHRAVV